MGRRFAKVLEEEIEEGFIYPSDLVNTKTTIPLRVGEGRWIYTWMLQASVYIHHYSPLLRGIAVYYLMVDVQQLLYFSSCTCLQLLLVLTKLILIYFQPTITHYFIRMLNDKGLLLRNYTQVQNLCSHFPMFFGVDIVVFRFISLSLLSHFFAMKDNYFVRLHFGGLDFYHCK